MNLSKKYYSPYPNVMKFVTWEVPDFDPKWPAVRLMDAIERDPDNIPADLMRCVPPRDGSMIVRQMGWQFDYTPYMKSFVGKITVWDDDWSETELHTFHGLSEKDVRDWIAENGYRGSKNVELHWLIPEPEEEV